MKNLLFIIFTLTFVLHKSQQSQVSTGGEITSSYGSVSFSIGQIVYTSTISKEGSVFQGVQQPFEVTTYLETSDIKNKNINMVAFPNPTYDNITLRNTNTDLKNYLYILIDSSGKIITKDNPKSTDSLLVMKNLPSGIYFLYVSLNSKTVKIFKIIKK